MKRANHLPNTRCDYCGKEVFKFPYHLKKHKNNFCGTKCQGKFVTNIANHISNVVCAYCGKGLFRFPYRLKLSKDFFCNSKCKGKWASKNLKGENGYNWRGGAWNNRVQYLAHTSYRTWRKKVLKNADCILCGATDKLELHHIIERKYAPHLVESEENVVPMCSKCHDVFHSRSSKGEELRESLRVILAYDNPQPSQSNVFSFVDWKVQRLVGEEAQTNNPTTRIAPERDEIVRTSSERTRS